MGWYAAAAAVAAAVGVHSAEQQRKATNTATDAAKAQALRANEIAKQQELASTRATNAANAKAPDVAAILAAAQKQGKTASTLLTGPQGVPTSDLTLGKTTLLGGG